MFKKNKNVHHFKNEMLTRQISIDYRSMSLDFINDENLIIKPPYDYQ